MGCSVKVDPYIRKYLIKVRVIQSSRISISGVPLTQLIRELFSCLPGCRPTPKKTSQEEAGTDLRIIA